MTAKIIDGVELSRQMREDLGRRAHALAARGQRPGLAVLQMQVTDQHLNFNGTCHGGAIFTLADTAFGLASNSHGAVAAAIDAHITYQVAVRSGDTLVARAVEVSRSRRLGVYRIDVTRGDGKPVSSFTGTVFITEGRHDDVAGAAPQ